MIDDDEKFDLIVLKAINLEDLSKYVDNSIVEKIAQDIIREIQGFLTTSELFSINYNEYIFMLKETDEDEVGQRLNDLIDDIIKPINIDNYSFRLQIKMGVYRYRGYESYGVQILNCARVAVDQGGSDESGVYYYNKESDNDRKLFYGISSALYDAIINNEFYLVYQPIIDLKDHTLQEAEVLIRWDRGGRVPVGPDVFIQIAERIGLITQISKWVVEQNLMHMNEWKNKDIDVKISVNLTTQEIVDDGFRQWLKSMIEESDIERSRLGFELTERVFRRME